jgi:2-succinyl-6-hydroxy-2,4-cyclohexadiene-1-carboxylate synthase
MHGFTGSSAVWDGVRDELVGAGCAPVHVDLPGHGRNIGRVDRLHFTLDAALEAIEAAGSWPTDLIGYSMGGRLALHFAVRHPELVRRLVLESASPGLADERARKERRRADQTLADRIVSWGVRAFTDEWERRPIFETHAALDPAVRRGQRERRLANDGHSLAAALRGLGTGALPHLWDRLGEVQVPTLLMAGALDRKFVEIARSMAMRMPRARVVEIEGSGHTIHLERPSAWTAAVLDFLRAD